MPAELVDPHQMSGPAIKPFVGRVSVSVNDPDGGGGDGGVGVDPLLNVGAQLTFAVRLNEAEQLPPQLLRL